MDIGIYLEFGIWNLNMNANIFNVRKHRWWGLAPLFVLIWHGVYTVYYLHADYLLFICYTANLALGTGIILRSGLLIGTGFGWIVIAFPLWLYDAILHSEWELSCTAFHICGLIVGAMAVRRYRLPKHTWAFALAVAVVLQFLSRVLTDESLNVNAAFRVYEGWEGLFSNYIVYFFVMLSGFGAFFVLLTLVNNKYRLPDNYQF